MRLAYKKKDFAWPNLSAEGESIGNIYWAFTTYSWYGTYYYWMQKANLYYCHFIRKKTKHSKVHGSAKHSLCLKGDTMRYKLQKNYWVSASSGSWWGQGGLASCSPLGHRESDTTVRLNWTDKYYTFFWWRLRVIPQGKRWKNWELVFRKRDKTLTGDKRKIRKNTEGKLTVR